MDSSGRISIDLCPKTNFWSLSVQDKIRDKQSSSKSSSDIHIPVTLSSFDFHTFNFSMKMDGIIVPRHLLISLHRGKIISDSEFVSDFVFVPDLSLKF